MNNKNLGGVALSLGTLNKNFGGGAGLKLQLNILLELFFFK